jgi:hypothetical protein
LRVIYRLEKDLPQKQTNGFSFVSDHILITFQATQIRSEQLTRSLMPQQVLFPLEFLVAKPAWFDSGFWLHVLAVNFKYDWIWYGSGRHYAL